MLATPSSALHISACCHRSTCKRSINSKESVPLAVLHADARTLSTQPLTYEVLLYALDHNLFLSIAKVSYIIILPHFLNIFWVNWPSSYMFPVVCTLRWSLCIMRAPLDRWTLWGVFLQQKKISTSILVVFSDLPTMFGASELTCALFPFKNVPKCWLLAHFLSFTGLSLASENGGTLHKLAVTVKW